MSIWSLLSSSWVRSQRYSRVSSRPSRASRELNLSRFSERHPSRQFENLEERVLLSASMGDETSEAILNGHEGHHHPVLTTSDGVIVDDYVSYIAPQQHLYNLGEFLSEASSDAPLDIALDFLRSHAVDLGLAASDIDNIAVTDQYVSQNTGVTHIYLRQTYDDIEIVDAEININISSQGEVINVGSSFVAGLHNTKESSPSDPLLTASGALSALANEFGWTIDVSPSVLNNLGGNSQSQVLTSGGISMDDIPVELHYIQTAEGDIELGWNMVVRTTDGDHWFEASVSADDGELIYLSDWVNDAQYNVYAVPLENPNDGDRTIEVDPQDTTASPFGWHDTDGAAGAEFTDTRGNNVFAQEDRDDNNTGGYRPDGGAALNFDFPIDFTQEPATYEDAAITNLFYVNNILHDVHYHYGFDEASGNFQVNNYGNGGLGGDAVQADAQDGSGFNNANFATPPDGFAPRMQQFIFDLTTPNRDSDLSNSIIIHEYGHGVSNRLTGGAGNSGALNAIQSGGMGEGWSDWWSLMFTQKVTDGQFDSYAVGDYVLDNPAGIRRFPYSFDMSVNPLTYDDFNGGFPNNQVHNAGEIWASALWDLNWLLINGDGGGITGMGFDPDLYSGTGGNNLAMQLVMDGLKFQPSNPSFLDARDAILLADQVANGGANQLAIWTAFARRGMGFSAEDGGSGNSTSVVAAFDLPAGPTGEVEFDAEFYEVGDTVTINVRDFDLSGGGPIDVQVVSTSGDIETVTLSEIALGVFEASITTAATSAANDGILDVRVDDVITVTYNDADDGSGNPAVVMDSADIILLTTVFEQDFETGLGENENLHGTFTINDTNVPLNNGTLMVGHPGNYGNFDYSYYEVTLDLRGFEHVQMEFEYAARMEGFFDGFNIQASTSDIMPPDDLIEPLSGLQYSVLNTDPFFVPRPEIGGRGYDSGGSLDTGVAVFDLSAFDGEFVTLRFQFGSDVSITDAGINFDNILVQGSAIEAKPIADAGGPYVFGTRNVIRLDASETFDINQPNNTLTYEWDFDNDGQFDDARGMRPYFTVADLNGQNSAVVRLKVTDSNGTYDGAKTQVFLEDPSRLRILGDTNGVVGQMRRITLDLGPTATEPQYTYLVNWGDGRPTRTVRGPNQLMLSNIYNETGNFVISVTAINLRTGLNTTDTHRINIGSLQRQGGDLAVSGTNGDDVFRLISRGGDYFELRIDNRILGTYFIPGRVQAFGLAGNDTFKGDWGGLDVLFDGGSGDDTSYTHDGNNIIYGKAGDDTIIAYGGTNFVDAGSGNNVIRTNSGNDRIFAGDGDDDIRDSGGNNEIHAGDGDNKIYSGRGNDLITSGSGADRIVDDHGNNRIEAGDGENNITTTFGNDTIFGGAHKDKVSTAGGNNLIYTFAGDDFIYSWGNNFIDPGTGHDHVFNNGVIDLFEDRDDDELFGLLASN